MAAHLGRRSQRRGTADGLSDLDVKMDNALTALYDSDRKGGLGSSAPNVNRWLGDIRNFFPTSVVQVLQKDAIERLKLTSLLLEKEMLETVEADVHLVATLLSLKHILPDKTKATARQVVEKVVNELVQKLSAPMHQQIKGAINRSAKIRRPKHNEMDWNATIQKNLRHYQPDYKTIIPETRIGYGHKRKALKEVVLCLDQSGSMGTSVVYTGIFGSVIASIPSVQTRMVVFDTAVVDLTEDLQDPVDILFGVQLGGGTDIDRALTYCQQIITRPTDTVLVLITDLYEGGNEADMRQRMTELVSAGVQFIVLLALNDDGAPSYDHQNAQFLATLGVPVFACTPDLFPELMAAALGQQDVQLWAASREIGVRRG